MLSILLFKNYTFQIKKSKLLTAIDFYSNSTESKIATTHGQSLTETGSYMYFK